jgi:hypothetical protein
MMSERDFDLRLERVLLADAGRAVRPFDAVAIAQAAVAATPSTRRLGWRPSGWPVIRLAIVIGLLVLVALATLWLVAGGLPTRPSLVDVVPTSPAPSTHLALDGTWLADAGLIADLQSPDPRLSWVVDAAGRTTHLEMGLAGVHVLHATAATDPDGSLVLTSDQAGLGCHVGDVGRYGTAVSADGVTVVITPRSDACGARAKALGRTWWRSLDASSTTGRGVIAPFAPGIVVTLPAGPRDRHDYVDAVEVGAADGSGTLYAIKDPWGLSQPCSPSGGSPVELPVDLAAYTAYVKSVPGFGVAMTRLAIDGNPAVHLQVTSSAGIDCPGGVVIEWMAKADAPNGVTWHLEPGDPDSVYLVTVSGHVFLLQYLGPSVTTADELQVMDSIQFVDGLAGTP